MECLKASVIEPNTTSHSEVSLLAVQQQQRQQQPLLPDRQLIHAEVLAAAETSSRRGDQYDGQALIDNESPRWRLRSLLWGGGDRIASTVDESEDDVGTIASDITRSNSRCDVGDVDATHMAAGTGGGTNWASSSHGSDEGEDGEDDCAAAPLVLMTPWQRLQQERQQGQFQPLRLPLGQRLLGAALERRQLSMDDAYIRMTGRMLLTQARIARFQRAVDDFRGDDR